MQVTKTDALNLGVDFDMLSQIHAEFWPMFGSSDYESRDPKKYKGDNSEKDKKDEATPKADEEEQKDQAPKSTKMISDKKQKKEEKKKE